MENNNVLKDRKLHNCGIGKSKLIFFVFFLVFASCGRSESSNDSVVSESFWFKYQILTIGHHDYLFVKDGYGAGLCHYEDCSFCSGKEVSND